ncbi:putative transcriptional regulator [Neobacillus sp. B4I6]|jgi:putative transcriptional regulator|uniref:helix-turn-helix domain-containing protein n=1 Tax=Neobacillus sp. B4I6 TaxID=3373925 RepID=UPI003D24F66C
MVVKNNLRVLMARKGVNIQDVSDATGLSRKSISKLYNESSIQITFDVIARLCVYFNCEVNDLLFLEGSES